MRKIFISVVLSYFRFFAQLALFIHKPKVIGITGSVGKSSARNAVSSVLKDYFSIKVIEKGNSETGIPLGILGLTVNDYSATDWLRLMLQAPLGLSYLRGTKYLVVEMGVDDPYAPKNMGYLLTIVKPQIAIFLNAFPVHTLQFEAALTAAEKEMTKGDAVGRIKLIVHKIAKEKGRIITESGCELGIYNADNSFVKEVIQNYELKITNDQLHTNSSSPKTKLFYFGQDEKNNIHYGSYDIDTNGSLFTFYLNWNDKKESILIKINGYILPKEYQEILSAAILVGKYAGLSNFQITQSLQKHYKLPKGRASLFKGVNNSMIIDSSYNASKAAVIAFLNLAYQLKIKLKRELVFIFGDMRELGEEAEAEHLEVAEKIVEGVDYLYCVGELTKQYVIPYCETRNIKHETLKHIKHFQNSSELGRETKETIPQDAIILVKGSQNTIFLEEAVKELLADKNDAKNLCRQEEFWIKKKGLN